MAFKALYNLNAVPKTFVKMYPFNNGTYVLKLRSICKTLHRYGINIIRKGTWFGRCMIKIFKQHIKTGRSVPLERRKHFLSSYSYCNKPQKNYFTNKRLETKHFSSFLLFLFSLHHQESIATRAASLNQFKAKIKFLSSKGSWNCSQTGIPDDCDDNRSYSHLFSQNTQIIIEPYFFSWLFLQLSWVAAKVRTGFWNIKGVQLRPSWNVFPSLMYAARVLLRQTGKNTA